MKLQDSGSKSYIECARNGVGIAFAGALKAAEVALKVTTAVFAVQSGFGIGRVEGFSAPGNGTELQALCDYNLSKVPEHFVQQEQLTPIEKQAKTLRAVAEKAKEDPQFARRLLETWKGKQQNKGTERLTPDKIDPEVWNNVRKMLTEKTPISDQQNNSTRRELNTYSGTTVVLVHGIQFTGPFANGSGEGANCDGGYWGDTINFLKSRGYTNIRTVGFYSGDQNCDVDLHNSAYQDKCDYLQEGAEGTNNESLNHISCLLAQYLNQNLDGQKVILVGHSMGGIIIRNTMFLVQKFGGQYGLPSSIGHITDAVTFNTPHAGVASVGDSWTCGGCTQVNELTDGSNLMTDLAQYAQNPQVPGANTQWTVVGSECDPIVGFSGNPDGAANAIAMDASHAIMYSKQDSATCYSHTSALGDSSTTNDATLYYCDTNNPTGNPCGTDYQSNAKWKKTTTGSRGLQTLYGSVGR